MKKIGIFLGFGPDQPIKNQGLGRLMAFMLQGIFALKDTKVIIATPAWHKRIILEFMQDQQIDMQKIELVTTPGIPIFLRVKSFLGQLFRSRKQGIAKPLSRFQLLVLKLKANLKYCKNYVESPALRRSEGFPFRFLGLMFLFSVLGILFSPLLLILMLKYGGRHVKAYGRKIIFKWLSLSSPLAFVSTGFLLFLLGLLLSPLILTLALIKAYRHLKLYLKPLIYAKLQKSVPNDIMSSVTGGPLSGLKNYHIAHEAYNVLRSHEMRKLIKELNKRKDVSVWYVPSLFWPEIGALHAKKVVAAPDVVFVDFPSQFLDLHNYYHFTYQNIKQTIASADHFICYSNYVKQKHLVDSLFVEPAKVSVINHGVIDLSHYAKDINAAKQILDHYQSAQAATLSPYLNDFDFNSMRFIFYSSQIRPYKNFLNLVKAYEILLRKRFINMKLVITADLNFDKTVKDYVISRRLQHDIISLPHVSSKVLAALNQLAVCSVNPSLFEGGFPFTFAEAYSVGTPSIMSEIPVVTAEIEDEALRKAMLFDPYDLNDMTNKIEWAVNHRDELYALQKPLYDKFKHRTWDKVAQEYVDLLNQFAATA